MRKVVRSLGYFVLVAALLGAAWYARQKLSPPPLPIEARIRTTPVSRGPLSAKVTASGTLSALVTVQVGSQVSGRIAELHVDFNSPVKKGQLIARIDPQLFQAALEQARANLMAAEGSLARAKAQAEDADRQADRQKALVARQLIAQADFDTAQSAAAAARAGVQVALGAVEQARAALHHAQINLAYTNIHSPIDGVVISRNVDVGQTVAASLQAPTLFTIAEDLTRMQVDTNVAEADIGKLAPGMEATFVVDAHPHLTFRGKIRQIRNAPITVQNVVTYDAVIDVANPESKLKPGMTANVTVVHASADDVLRIPNAGLRFRPTADLLAPTGDAGAVASRGRREGGRRPDGPRQVWVLREGALHAATLQTGITDGTLSEVKEGDLAEGDLVAIEALETATPSRTGSNPLAPQPVRGMRRL